MTIDVIIRKTRTLPFKRRIAELEVVLRHYYFKSVRLEHPRVLAVRRDRIAIVPNTIGLHTTNG